MLASELLFLVMKRNLKGRMVRIAAIICLHALVLPHYALCQDDVTFYLDTAGWKLSKSKNNIIVYTRTPPETKVKEFRAITTMAASLDEIKKVLLDINSYTRWIDHLDSAKELGESTSTSAKAYSRLSVPWPFNDRDAVTLMTTRSSPAETIILLQLRPDDIPQEDNVVRLRIGRGKWHLIKVSDNSTKVIYQFFADPGGYLPAWIVNLFVVDGPYKTLKNLSDMTMTRPNE